MQLLPELQRLLGALIGMLHKFFQGLAAHTASNSSIESWVESRVHAPAVAAFHGLRMPTTRYSLLTGAGGFAQQTNGLFGMNR